jgi:hypothetical protein
MYFVAGVVDDTRTTAHKMCHTHSMAFTPSQLDPKRWFDRMFPQTLQIATWLLYLNGFFALLAWFDNRDEIGYLRATSTLGAIFGLIACLTYVAGGFLMANGLRLGYRIAIFAAISPFIVRNWAYIELGNNNPLVDISLWDRIAGTSLFTFIFDVALIALLLHRHSANHAKIWLK